MHKYIHMLDCEIEQLIDHEKRNGGLSADAEKTLHVLFENRKHAMMWEKERDMEKVGRERAAAQM